MLEWGKSPWGQDVPVHIAFYLLWVSAIAGLLFLIIHAIWIRYFAKPDEYAEAFQQAPAHAYPTKFLGTRSARGCSTGSWRRPCLCCSSRLSCRRWACGLI